MYVKHKVNCVCTKIVSPVQFSFEVYSALGAISVLVQNTSNDILASWLVDEIEVNASLTRSEGAGPWFCQS